MTQENGKKQAAAPTAKKPRQLLPEGRHISPSSLPKVKDAGKVTPPYYSWTALITLSPSVTRATSYSLTTPSAMLDTKKILKCFRLSYTGRPTKAKCGRRLSRGEGRFWIHHELQALISSFIPWASPSSQHEVETIQCHAPPA